MVPFEVGHGSNIGALNMLFYFLTSDFHHKASLQLKLVEKTCAVEVLTLTLGAQSGRDSCRAIRQKDVKEAAESAPNTSPYTRSCKRRKSMMCVMQISSSQCLKRTYRHVSILHTWIFCEMPIRSLPVQNQKLDGITDGAAVHRDQRLGHCEHLSNIRRQPLMRKTAQWCLSCIGAPKRDSRVRCPTRCCSVDPGTQKKIHQFYGKQVDYGSLERVNICRHSAEHWNFLTSLTHRFQCVQALCHVYQN